MWRRADSIFRLLTRKRYWFEVWNLKWEAKCPHQYVGLRYTTDIVKERQPTTDVLTEQLKHVDSGEAIQKLILDNQKILDVPQLVVTFEKLAEMYRKEKNTVDNVSEIPYLPTLCRHLIKKSRFLELDQLISVIRSFSFLKVPSDSVVMQVLLQHLRLQINDLTLGQIKLLDRVLRKLSSTPLVNALRVALPLVAENHLDMQLHGSDLYRLVDWFFYGCQHQFRIGNIRKIAQALLDETEAWTERDSRNVLWGFVLFKQPFEERDALLSLATEAFCNKIYETPKNVTLELMYRLLEAHLLSEQLLKAVSRKALTECWELQWLHTWACILSGARYLDTALLEVYAGELEKHISRNALNLPIHEVVSIFSSANFVPSTNDTLVEWILRQEEQIILLQSDAGLLLRFALDLTILKVDLSRICNTILGGKPLPHLHPSKCFGNRLADLAILRTFIFPEYWNENLDVLFPPWLQKLTSQQADVKCREASLHWALQKGVGSQYHIYDNVISKSGICIDHVLINHNDLRNLGLKNESEQDGYSQHQIDVANLDVYKIAVILHSPNCYATNVYRLNGTAVLLLSALQKEGFSVVEICQDHWTGLLEHELIPYVKRAIYEALNT